MRKENAAAGWHTHTHTHRHICNKITYNRAYVELSNTTSSIVNSNHLIRIYFAVFTLFLLPSSVPRSGRVDQTNCQVQLEFPTGRSHGKQTSLSLSAKALFFSPISYFFGQMKKEKLLPQEREKKRQNKKREEEKEKSERAADCMYMHAAGAR